MPDEVITGLGIQPHGTYIDGTLGGGGHSALIARRLTTGRLIGIDRDNAAIQAATARIKHPGFTAVRGNFHNVALPAPLHGILLDLGVSSHQLDTAARGFSYRSDMAGPLDMRMDKNQPTTAADIVNTYDERALAQILFDYGEERRARKIARAITAARPLSTTAQLADIIESCLGKKPGVCSRTFQALRIAVNDELAPLADTIRSMIAQLSAGGRIAIITFHSLEDRLVKNTFVRLARPCTCPRDIPYCVCGLAPQIKILTAKPITPSARELQANPRAHSAKLRIAERV